MPFHSKAQMRAAFAGALGPEMKGKAREFAHATPDIKSLPYHVSSKRATHAFGKTGNHKMGKNRKGKK